MSGRTVRDDFAELLTSEDRSAIVEALKGFVTAGKLTRFECEKCGAENHVPTPDAKLRLDTLKFMTEQGLGKLLTEESRPSAASLAGRDMRSLSDDELEMLSAAGAEETVMVRDPESGKWADVDPLDRSVYEAARRVVEDFEREHGREAE